MNSGRIFAGNFRLSGLAIRSLLPVVPSASEQPSAPESEAASSEAEASAGGKVSSSKLAQKFGFKTAQLLDRATELGHLEAQGDKHIITTKGQQAGIELVAKSRFGPYFVWPQDFQLA